MHPLLRSPVAWFTGSPARRTAAKLLLAAALILAVTFEGLALARQPSGPHAAVWACGVLVCLCAVPWRGVPLAARGWIAVAVSGATTLALMFIDRPQLVWGLGEAAALLVLLTGVLLNSPARQAAVLGTCLGLACVAAPVRDARPGAFTLLFSVVAAVVSAFSLLLRIQAGQRQRDIAAVRAAERLELARELHDLVAHHVTGIVVQARAARFTALSGQAAAGTFGRIEEAGDEALGAMRRLVRVLREDEAQTAPVAGIAELRDLTEAFARTGPPTVVYVDPVLEERLPADLAATAHHIVREALTNTRKHAADATAVRVAVRVVAGGVEVRVADDGTQPGPAGERGRQDGGFGLTGLEERVRALGGELVAGRSPEGGWEVRAVLPYGRAD
ncbi:sensor histidine kinase [Actinomycetota bacterium Odt1-20B]